MASNDPTDTGGLFIGRRPGTGPVRYRDRRAGVGAPPARRHAAGTRSCSRSRLLLCLSLFGPQPLAWLWIGSQVDYLTGYVTAGITTVMLGCLASLMITMALAKRVDHAWKLVRRAAGHEQERGRARAHLRRSSVAIAAVGLHLLVPHHPGAGADVRPAATERPWASSTTTASSTTWTRRSSTASAARAARGARRRMALERLPDLDLSGTEWPDMPALGDRERGDRARPRAA